MVFLQCIISTMEKEKIVLGMSGGVDSSVAAIVLQKMGYDVLGVTVNTWRESDSDTADFLRETEDAKSVCEELHIPHFVYDCRELFKEKVVVPFCSEYIQGATPNPCILCNRYLKWGALLDFAAKQGAEKIATGHYGKILRLPDGSFTIQKSDKGGKDQSYALCRLTQEQLSKTIFPIGDLTKAEVRAIAKDFGLALSEKKDSEEICFIPDNDHGGFLERFQKLVPSPGNFVDREGRVLGPHKGIFYYTIGQRKGLNLAMGHPVYVVELRPDRNEVVIGENEDLFRTDFICTGLNTMGISEFSAPLQGIGKIRYLHKGTSCEATPLGRSDSFKVHFDEPVRAITPGQAFVLYRDDYILLSGFIEKVL